MASLTSSVANVAFAAPAAPSSSADSGWTAEQSRFLADAIEAAPRARDGKGESERWKKIAACVPGKDAKQCHERYKAMKEEMRAAKAGRE